MQKDFYVEQLVKRRLRRSNYIARVVAVAGAVLLTAFGWLIAPSYAIIIMAAGIIGGWLLFKIQNVDFEYTFYNGDFVVYRIINQWKRQKMLSTNMAHILVMAPEMPAYQHLKDSYSIVKTVHYTETHEMPNRWFIIFKGDTGSLVCAILQPSERMFQAMSHFLGDKVRTEHGTELPEASGYGFDEEDLK